MRKKPTIIRLHNMWNRGSLKSLSFAKMEDKGATTAAASAPTSCGEELGRSQAAEAYSANTASPRQTRFLRVSLRLSRPLFRISQRVTGTLNADMSPVMFHDATSRMPPMALAWLPISRYSLGCTLCSCCQCGFRGGGKARGAEGNNGVRGNHSLPAPACCLVLSACA